LVCRKPETPPEIPAEREENGGGCRLEEAGESREVATLRAGGGPVAGVRRRADTAAERDADGGRRAAEEEVDGVLRRDGIGVMMMAGDETATTNKPSRRTTKIEGHGEKTFALDQRA